MILKCRTCLTCRNSQPSETHSKPEIPDHKKLPKELITNNDPEFSSQKFRSFSKTWDKLHKSLSPHYHQSNELTERSIQTLTQTLNVAKLYSEDHFLLIFSLNSQPDENGASPAEKIIRSQMKNLVFTYTIYLKYHFQKAHHYPKLRLKLPEIAPGTTVRIRTDEQNSLTIIQYTVLNERGNMLPRPLRHLTSATKKFIMKHDYDDAIPVSNTGTHLND